MKLIDLVNARHAIMSHANENLPLGVTYKLMKFLKLTDTENELYIKELNKIIDAFCEKDNNGVKKFKNGNPVISNALIDECNEKLAQLQETEVDKPPFTFMLDELAPIKFTVIEMTALDEFIQQPNRLKGDDTWK